MNRLWSTTKVHWRVLSVYGVGAVLVLWPLLAPGYVLTLDMVFAPKLPLPEVVTSSYLLHAGFHLLNMIVPSDVIQKVMLFAILILSGTGMHRLMRFLRPTDVSRWAAYAGGLLYMINPFVYSRFMAGQYSVLLGYAFLPFFVMSLLRFLRGPSLKTALVLTGWIIGISIVSIHTLGLAGVIGILALAHAMWQQRSHVKWFKQIAKYIVMVAILFFVASSYWLLPLLQGSGPTASSIATFQTSDQSAFETEGSGAIGKLVHVMRLQGFWGEREGLYLLPQEQFVLWPVVVLALWVLIAIGVRSLWRDNRGLCVLFASSATIAALLAVGVGVAWLAEHVPFFAGYREPQKFAALVALSYAVFFGFATAAIVNKLRTKAGRVTAGIVVVSLVVGFTPVMFHGFDGQLAARHYPADWYAVDEQLNNDRDDFEVLFLPWHLYMRYQFAGRVIAHPAQAFFDKPMITSDNPELGTTKPAIADAKKQYVTNHILPQAAGSDNLGEQLESLDIKYVILAKDADYESYDYLDRQKDLQLVRESATLKLYRNNAFGKESK